MAKLNAIFKCKLCNEVILDEGVVFKKLEDAVKKIKAGSHTHNCENHSASRKIGLLEHVGFYEHKL
jgi:hypothetical protein